MATGHLTGTHNTDLHSIDDCRRLLETPDLDSDEEYRLARAKVIFAARDRLEALLGVKLSLMEQRYVRDIAFGVVPWAIEQRVKFPDANDLETIHPVQETVARYMRDVLRISLEEFREYKKAFGKDRVLKHVRAHHESLHRP